MDGNRFDSLARAVAVRPTRRTALSALAGAVLTGALAGFGPEVSAARCKGDGGKCKRSNDCCQGLKCKKNKGECVYKESCGGTKGDFCEFNDDCCEGLECDKNKEKCKYKNNCGGKAGDFCQKNKECCDGFRCKNDTCKRCKTRNEQCNSNKNCCPGFNCRQGLCKD